LAWYRCSYHFLEIINYPSTLANSTLIILFSELLKFSKLIISSKSKNIVRHISEYLGIFLFVEMNFSKLINYSTDMCWNGQGTRVCGAVGATHFPHPPCQPQPLHSKNTIACK
jgi:hypothetical protein